MTKKTSGRKRRSPLPSRPRPGPHLLGRSKTTGTRETSAPKISLVTKPLGRDTKPVLPPWSRLNCTDRLRPSSLERSPFDHRSDFESDFDRVTFSSSFRRLQDKTQVFPLEKHDFIRTRLSHSCEVSAKGRALGISAALALANKNIDRNLNALDCGAIVATACLLHDIGNPPFGHFGEQAIGTWFGDALKQQRITLDSPQERSDLCDFEGNANALRVATRLQFQGSQFGLNLTVGTLAALIKYPCSSIERSKDRKETKKFGYFLADKAAFLQIRKRAALPGTSRHPLTYLMEAADDIAYSSVDIEDGLKKRIVDLDLIISALGEEIAKVQDEDVKSELSKLVEDHLKTRFQSLSKLGLSKSEREQYAYQHFRGVAVGKMASSSVECFVEKYDEILAGSFHGSLPSAMTLAPLCRSLKDLADRLIYSHATITRIEVAARRVITELLNVFFFEVRDRPGGKVARLVPSVPQNDGDDSIEGLSSDYCAGLRVACYIAGMTDRYATDLYRQFVGIDL